jgi:5-methylcytosine-specific restriction endonuclease McrA
MHQKTMFYALGQKSKHTVSGLVLEFFTNHPCEEFTHNTVVDWVTERWLEENEHAPRDPWRATRKLHQEGILIKVRKGVYKYDPDQVQHKDLWDFPESVREEILERDGYRCVICGRGKEDGVELTVDHIKPRDHGGTNDKENGQTLCTEHNLLKKNYSQTEAAKRYFVKLYNKALATGDRKMIRFCRTIFDAYDMFGVDAHIDRPDNRHKSVHPENWQHVFFD